MAEQSEEEWHYDDEEETIEGADERLAGLLRRSDVPTNHQSRNRRGAGSL